MKASIRHKAVGGVDMKRLAFSLLLLMLVLAGCRMEQSTISNGTAVSANSPYSSNISVEDCYICGNGIENLIPSYWGQNNIALISLHTFEIKPQNRWAAD